MQPDPSQVQRLTGRAGVLPPPNTPSQQAPQPVMSPDWWFPSTESISLHHQLKEQ
jgi:hypothetical protein